MLCFLEKRLAEKSIFKRLPPLTPPYTGGELITKRFLPLCKGELEGVVLLDKTFYTASWENYAKCEECVAIICKLK